MKKPEVSVIMSTYNHQDYVDAAIDSVLAQEGVDFEFLIADDGSSDATQDVVRQYEDPRIQFHANAVNRGACESINDLIGRATGEFIALINSDDVWSSSDKLRHQLEIFKQHPEIGASFGRARFIDKNDQIIDKADMPLGAIFDQVNKTQGEWLRHFFFYGNCLCHPTILIRKTCYEALSAYNNRYRQLPDYDMWVRLIKRYPIHVSERELVDFRYLPGENASSPTMLNSIRTVNEHFVIAESFLEDAPYDLLLSAFGDILPSIENADPVHADIARVLPYFYGQGHLKSAYALIGQVKLKKLLDNPAHRHVLKANYGIDDHWFHRHNSAEACLSIRPDMIQSEETHRQVEANLQAQIQALTQRAEGASVSVLGRLAGIFQKN